MLEMIKRLVKEEEGQGMVEYGLIIVAVALVALAGLKLLGGDETSGLKGFFTKLANKITITD